MKSTFKKLTSIILAVTMIACLAACSNANDDSKETQHSSTTQQVKPETTTQPPTAQPIKPQELEVKGTNGGSITFHTDGTYDFICTDYYLTTKETPALKALLLFADDEQKKYITEKDGYQALGPVQLNIDSDGYSIKGGTLSLKNEQKISIKGFDWELDAISTVTSNDGGYKVSIKGDNGQYQFNFSDFNISAEQAKYLGL